MNLILRVGRLVMLGALLLLAAGSTASHMLGGSLTYYPIGNNDYLVRATLHQDCGGSVAMGLALVYRPAGCGSTSGISAAMPSTGTPVLGSPFCAQVPWGTSGCNSGLPSNYQTNTYDAVVTLPPGRWTLSVTANARPTLANTAGDDLYLEATLDNTAGANHSAVFATAPVHYAGLRQLNRFSTLAYDADGDSLVYSLAAPMTGCNEPITYKPLPLFYDASPLGDTTCFGVPTGTSPVFNAAFPIPSFTNTGACPIVVGTPFFPFAQQTGDMSFVPALTYNLATPGPVPSSYLMSVRVDEYRRQPSGTYQLVGTVRHDLVTIVTDLANQNPALSSLSVNGAAQAVGSPITARAGQPLTLQLASTDADAGQTLTLASNAAQLLPGSQFVAAANGTATLTWTPPTTLRPGLYYCTIVTTDNGCPLIGTEQRTLAFRVTNAALATQTARKPTTLTAVPTPFRGQVSFRLAQAGVQTVVVTDQLGRQVATLRSQPSGEVSWRPDAGMAPGIYLARTPDGRQVARLLRTDAE